MSDKSGLSGQGGVEMTDEAIEAYLLSLGLRGRTEGTLQSYRNRLHMLRSSWARTGCWTGTHWQAGATGCWRRAIPTGR